MELNSLTIPKWQVALSVDILAGDCSSSTIELYRGYFAEYVEYCGSPGAASRPEALSLWREALLGGGVHRQVRAEKRL